jgi:hypothetical protein
VRRGVTVAGAVFLGAVPTYFTVFPYPEHLALRVLVFAAWVGLAAFAAHKAFHRDEKLDKFEDQVRAERERRRSIALAAAVRAMCSHPAGFPSGYTLTVYLPNAEGDLVPSWPASEEPGDDPRIFRPGTGATGVSWQRYLDGSRLTPTVVVSGDAVSNDVHGLTEAQQKHFAGYRTVAATVIVDERDERVGVLTAISLKQDGFFDEHAAGQALLRTLAGDLGVVLERLLPPDFEPM